jgi:hypothetical protein
VDIGELSSFLAEKRSHGEELIDHDLFESWLETTTSMLEAGMYLWLKASYTSSLRAHTPVAYGLIHQ